MVVCFESMCGVRGERAVHPPVWMYCGYCRVKETKLQLVEADLKKKAAFIKFFKICAYLIP